MRQSHHILEVTPHYQYVFKQRCPLRNLISPDLLSGVHGRGETASGLRLFYHRGEFLILRSRGFSGLKPYVSLKTNAMTGHCHRVGLALTREDIPALCRVLYGNQHDSQRVAQPPKHMVIEIRLPKPIIRQDSIKAPIKRRLSTKNTYPSQTDIFICRLTTMGPKTASVWSASGFSFIC
jgi:hypothetical protein